MKPVGRPAVDQQPESIEFVPKRDLDRAQQEIDRLRKENERLQPLSLLLQALCLQAILRRRATRCVRDNYCRSTKILPSLPYSAQPTGGRQNDVRPPETERANRRDQLHHRVKRRLSVPEPVGIQRNSPRKKEPL
jgi:hypothetical protein